MNHAVELLVRGPNGWTHRFVKNPFTQLCRICNCYPNEHLSEINRMQEERDRIFARDMNSGARAPFLGGPNREPASQQLLINQMESIFRPLPPQNVPAAPKPEEKKGELKAEPVA
jgi:hypothetical protein